MRILVTAAILSALAACGQPPAEIASEAPPAEATTPAVAPGPSAGIDGWEIDMTAYSQNGQALPAFTLKKDDGSNVPSTSLRDRWTIVGVWSENELPPQESTFVAALHSAVNQDPDLDLLMIVPPAPAGTLLTVPAEWPHVTDNDGSARAALALPATPAYLLIGPDLTIEGYRGALTASPDDGIKSVIRGVAEIRKQIAAPQ